MKRVPVHLLVAVIGLGVGLGAQTAPGAATRAAEVSIRLQTRMDPPRWAVLERQLLAANVPAAGNSSRSITTAAAT